MTDQEWRTSLRVAVHRGDGRAVVGVVRAGGVRVDALQLIGDGLLAAVTQRVEHAAELGADYANALRSRGWHGDDVLAEQLDAALGRARFRCSDRYRSTSTSSPESSKAICSAGAVASI